MKVNDINRVQGINKYQQFNKQNDNQLNQKEQKQDQLSISDEAKALLEQTKENPATSEEKVSQLKEQINNGTYKVDSQKVADKLVEYLYKK